MARAAGQLDKAERTYRALLLVVRRTPPGDDEAAVGPSEVLFELSQARRRRAARPIRPRSCSSPRSRRRSSPTPRSAACAAACSRTTRARLLLAVLEKRLATRTPSGEPGAPARRHGRGARPSSWTASPTRSTPDQGDQRRRPARIDLHERARELAQAHRPDPRSTSRRSTGSSTGCAARTIRRWSRTC